ncbi:MAG: DUF3006 domain-containing protein [Atopobiaceae bacterium]
MQAIVDRIEGGIAVLELEDQTFVNVRLSELPAGTSAGDALVEHNDTWELAPTVRTQRRRINNALMKRLFRR